MARYANYGRRRKFSKSAVTARFIRRFGSSAGDRAARIAAHARSIAVPGARKHRALGLHIASRTTTGGRAYGSHIASAIGNKSAAVKKAWGTRKRMYGKSGKRGGGRVKRGRRR